jgi:hypothetical protein
MRGSFVAVLFLVKILNESIEWYDVVKTAHNIRCTRSSGLGLRSPSLVGRRPRSHGSLRHIWAGGLAGASPLCPPKRRVAFTLGEIPL